ncbi:hypothetical protein C0992_011207 [Termitomyces sp. T32_za158]|nr:hypothetical protein C0992_011207 [Termitomyces sp. T32_za158]
MYCTRILALFVLLSMMQLASAAPVSHGLEGRTENVMNVAAPKRTRTLRRNLTMDDGGQGPHGHPYLHEPLLYISNLPAYVTDEALAMAFVACGPFRPRIPRDPTSAVLTGTIEFRFLDKAEKALATLQARPVPGTHPAVPLVLSPYPPTTPPTPLPPPSALPRLVKHLPPAFDDARLYDLFRPFGALASARTLTQFGPDTATVEFWNEDDARAAEEAMHCADVDGHNIAVHVYRTSAANAPPFVPSSPRPAPFVHGPGQQVQLAPLHGPGSSSHSGLIDPCNLFCKASLPRPRRPLSVV